MLAWAEVEHILQRKLVSEIDSLVKATGERIPRVQGRVEMLQELLHLRQLLPNKEASA